jgi:hypothetical protein
VIAAGFDHDAGTQFRAPAFPRREPSVLAEGDVEEEDIPVPSLLKESEEEDDLFQPTAAPAPAAVRSSDDGDGEDDLDIPDFLKG